MSGLFHSILGLPRSGKTTYLAALWHLIDAGEAHTTLVLDRLVGDHAYLNKIVEAWRRCEEVPRTSMGAEEKSLSIHVHERETGTKAILAFPDLSGESFERQFATRACTPEYVEGFEGEGGIVLFINADRPSDGMTILDIAPAVAEGDVQGQLQEQQLAEPPGEPDGQKQKIAVERWKPNCVPEQVRLVDLLQFIQRPPFRRRIRRIAVIISAWDVLGTTALQPFEWLAREMPLLDQFLANSPESFEVRVYGVSAQGGTVRGNSRIDLLKMSQPSLRIRCVGSNTGPHDLTAPLVWLSGGD